MSVPSIMVPNPAVFGDFHRPPAARTAFGAVAGAAAMMSVKLGAVLLPPEKKRSVAHFKKVFKAKAGGWTPPATTSWAAKGMDSIRRMYANDRLGICTFAACYHQHGVWTGNDTGTAVTVADQEAIDNYMRYGANPGHDDGSIPADVLTAWKRGLLTVNGRPSKIDGFVAVDWTNWDEVRAATYLFGPLHLSIDLPGSWANDPRYWIGPQRGIVGGHSVGSCDAAVDNGKPGVVILTWGGTRFMDVDTLAGLNRNTELYAVLSPGWYNDDRIAPCGVDANKLLAYLDVIDHGGIPDVTPPAPPAPPKPPTPEPTVFPTFDVNLTGPFGIKLSGPAVPRQDAPKATFGMPDQTDPFAPNGFWIRTGAPFQRPPVNAAALNPIDIIRDVVAIYTVVQNDLALKEAVTKLLVDLGLIHPTAAAAAWGDGTILKLLLNFAQQILPVILQILPYVIK